MKISHVKNRSKELEQEIPKHRALRMVYRENVKHAKARSRMMRK